MTHSPFKTRLSSTLTLPVRVSHAAVVIALAGGVVAGVADGSLTYLPLAIRVILIVGLPAAVAFVLHVFSFMDVRLDDRDIVVRGYWREWRIPASRIAAVSEREFRGWHVVRVQFEDRVPGLGVEFRFVPSLFAHPQGTAAEILQVVRAYRVAGA